MGANQAMRDAAEILPYIQELHRIAQSGHEPTENDFAMAVKQYEAKMIPRAFGWVRASGGTEMSVSAPCERVLNCTLGASSLAVHVLLLTTNLQLPDFSGIKGGILKFMIARALDVTYMFSLIRGWLGWKPKDDVPEFRD